MGVEGKGRDFASVYKSNVVRPILFFGGIVFWVFFFVVFGSGGLIYDSCGSKL